MHKFVRARTSYSRVYPESSESWGNLPCLLLCLDKKMASVSHCSAYLPTVVSLRRARTYLLLANLQKGPIIKSTGEKKATAKTSRPVSASVWRGK